MFPRYTTRLAVIFAAVGFTAATFPVAAWAQEKAAVEKPLAERLAALEKAFEGKWKVSGVPGASLVIVQDGKVIWSKGFGYRDVANKKPVTPDTLFAIGSSTKAFTAMAVVMAQEDGKLSLNDSPRKFLPYFKLQDPEANEKITIRDLLCHNSGLPRTDIAWISGDLSREDAIRYLADVKPTAKFREKFQYQNIQYAAAGDIAARAEKTSYDKLIENRILKPLGMTMTTLSVKTMQKSADYSIGYALTPKDPGSNPLPMRNLPAIAPAGAINSCATDMAKWVTLMLDGGTFNGKRLVSEPGFAELVKMQTPMGPNAGYGLGWMLRDWNGMRVVEHGGNVDGFAAQVAMIPEKKIGFVLLTNVSATTLTNTTMTLVWTHLVGKPEKPAAAVAAAGSEIPAKDEVGTYTMAGVNADVSLKDGVLTLTVTGQPPYPLEKVSGRRYKLGKPAPDGFFITFQPAKDKPDVTEASIEQPNGTFVLTRSAAQKPEEKAALTELIGTYEPEMAGLPKVEIADKQGKVSLVVPGQPPYPLIARQKDTYGSPGLPETYALVVRRDTDGKFVGLTLKQPEGEFAYKGSGSPNASKPAAFVPPLTVDELIAKMVDAAGGEAVLRKHTSLEMKAEVRMDNQGLKGNLKAWAQSPNRVYSEMSLLALGKKKVATIIEYVNDSAAGQWLSFMPDAPQDTTPDALRDAKMRARFQPLLDKKTTFKTLAITGKETVDGEECLVFKQTPEKGGSITEYVSTKTYLVVRRDSGIKLPEELGGGEMAVTEKYSDFRTVDGEKVAFRTVTQSPTMGETVVTVTEAKYNVRIPDDRFATPAKGKK
jgi:CubicO group peptidase (beta-lactamase class C family)